MSMNIKLDVRLPIGGMFAVDGLILAGYGLLAGRSDPVREAGMRITAAWGVVLLVFGAAMLGLALRARLASFPRPPVH
jgi:hypothetical protein